MKLKSSLFYFFLIPLIAICGCKEISTELSEAEKSNILEEVRSVVEEGIIAANNHEPDAMMKVHWNSDHYLAIVNGTIIKGWKPVHEIVSFVHSNPRNQSFAIEQQEVDIRILNDLTALVIAEGKFINVPTKDSTTTEKFALTMLMNYPAASSGVS
jgi:hypothetical protein